MAIFGALKKPSMFGQMPGVKRGPYDTPGIGDYGDMGVGAMQPNTQAMTKRPGFFGSNGRHIAGFIGDALQQIGGGQATYMPNLMAMRQQDAEIRARMAEEQRQQKAKRDNFLFEEQYKRANPMPANNDTINDFNWYKSLSDADKAIYQQMKPEYRQGPDGRFYRLDTATGPMPTFTADDWEKGQPLGGSVGNGAGGF